MNLIGVQPCMQEPILSPQAVLPEEELSRAGIGVRHTPASVQVDAAEAGLFEQFAKGRTQRTGERQRLANVNEAADVG